MNAAHLAEALDLESLGEEAFRLIADLYPICRSITGDGYRETLRRLSAIIPLDIQEVPSGTPVFDWTVPKEWNIRDAWVKDARRRRVIDFQRSNLHVVNYSVPVRRRLRLDELKEHLFSLPDHPDWIPYRTSYYKETWGFCLSNRQLEDLEDGDYEVCIDASLEDGSLTLGEYRLQGASDDEVLISCHACHPSLCNDNLSGVAIAVLLARALGSLSLRYSYRFLFIPGTIGSITWLALHETDAQHVRHGLVLTCLGDVGRFTYKRSRRGNAEIDRVVAHVLRHSGNDHTLIDFTPYGYDERQYCSPGFNLPVGCLMRTPHGQYPQYHTSADDLDFVRPAALADSLRTCMSVVALLEANRIYVSQNQKCEPQLGKRGLYRSIGGVAGAGASEMAMLWVLNLADGSHSLLDIAERSQLPFHAVHSAAETLCSHGLLLEVQD
jgi:aminopeptidase-like protein